MSLQDKGQHPASRQAPPTRSCSAGWELGHASRLMVLSPETRLSSIWHPHRTQTHLNKVNLKLLLQETYCAAQCPQNEGEASFLDLACGCVQQAVLHLGGNGPSSHVTNSNEAPQKSHTPRLLSNHITLVPLASQWTVTSTSLCPGF